MSVLIQIDHDFDHSAELPYAWNVKRTLMGPKTAALYEKLRLPVLDGEIVDIRRFAAKVGFSQNQIFVSLRELEAADFVTIVMEEDPMEVIVHEVPPLSAVDLAKSRELGEDDPSKWDDMIVEFCAYWVDLHERYLGTPIHTTAVDQIQVKKLVHGNKRAVGTYTIPHLKKIASYYWQHKTDKEPRTIRWFCSQIDRLAADYEQLESILI